MEKPSNQTGEKLIAFFGSTQDEIHFAGRVTEKGLVITTPGPLGKDISVTVPIENNSEEEKITKGVWARIKSVLKII